VICDAVDKPDVAAAGMIIENTAATDPPAQMFHASGDIQI